MPGNTSAIINLAAVDAPPIRPPVVGLIPALQVLGDPYLLDDEVEQVTLGIDPPIPLSPNRDGFGGQGGVAAPPRRLADVRWQMGYRYAPEQACIQGGVVDPYSVGAMTIPATPETVVGIPKLVWAGDICSTFGWSARDYVGRATRALLASESSLLAYELWTGTLAQAEGWNSLDVNWLASPEVIDVSNGTPVDPGVALALLEQGIADTSNGQPGMIYCTRQMGATLSELGNTFRNISGLIYTYMGSVICPDAGFPGSSPTGVAPTAGHQWAYATLLPQVRRSEISVVPETLGEAIDRGATATGLQNSLAFRAYRYADAVFPPCTRIACSVNLPLVGGGLS